MPQHSTPDTETDLRRYMRLVWRRKWIFLACAIVIPVAAYFISASGTKTYEASATLQIEPIGPTPATDAGVTVRSVAAAVRLAQTVTVAEAAAKKIRNGPKDPRRVLGSVAFSEDTTSGFVTITASAHSAQLAADTANAYATALQATRTAGAEAQINAAIQQSSLHLGKSRGAGSTAAALDLLQQLTQLRVARAEQKTATQVIQPAAVPKSPTSPSPARSAAIALVIGILVGLALIFLLDKLDTRIRETDEVEPLVGAPVLGVVPETAFPGHANSWAVTEAFQMLRASMTYFNVRPMRSIVVTSPTAGDGKTTVATNLAVAFARSGKDVILVDADLRHPQVEARLTEHAPVEDGLGSVIVGERELGDVLRDVDVDGVRFRIVAAGSPPPNPSELLGSARMQEIFEQLREHSDMVIIDTSPALLVSDPIPLLPQAAGVVVVAKLGATKRNALLQLVSIVRNARANLLGEVVTGAPERGGYGYGYGYYGSAPQDSPARRNGVAPGITSAPPPPELEPATVTVPQHVADQAASENHSGEAAGAYVGFSEGLEEQNGRAPHPEAIPPVGPPATTAQEAPWARPASQPAPAQQPWTPPPAAYPPPQEPQQAAPPPPSQPSPPQQQWAPPPSQPSPPQQQWAPPPSQPSPPQQQWAPPASQQPNTPPPNAPASPPPTTPQGQPASAVLKTVASTVSNWRAKARSRR